MADNQPGRCSRSRPPRGRAGFPCGRLPLPCIPYQRSVPTRSSPLQGGAASNQPRAWKSFSNCTKVQPAELWPCPVRRVIFCMRKQDKQGDTSCSESHRRQSRKASSAVSDLVTHLPSTAVCTGPSASAWKGPVSSASLHAPSSTLLSHRVCRGLPALQEAETLRVPAPYLTAPHLQDSPIHSINVRWGGLSSTARQIRKWGSILRSRTEYKRFTRCRGREAQRLVTFPRLVLCSWWLAAVSSVKCRKGLGSNI